MSGPQALEDLDLDQTPPDVMSSTWSFWLQRAHLLVTFHCLRLVFLQKYAELGISSLLVHADSPVILASRKMEIAHEFLNVLRGVPFECLRANGESCVRQQFPV